MSLAGDTLRVAMSDLYYLKRNILILLVTSLVTPLLYLLAFGYGLGQDVTMDGVSYMAFMIPGVVSLTTVTSSFTTVANKLMIQKRFYESFDEMMLCPISKTSMILGKSILGILKSMLCAFLMLLLGYLLTDDLFITPMLVLSVFVSCLVFSLLGVAAGMLVPDIPWMNLFNSFVILPMTFLCGTMFSLDNLPAVAKSLIELLPLTHTSNCVRAAALGWDFPWLSLGILAGYGVLFFLLGRFALRKTN